MVITYISLLIGTSMLASADPYLNDREMTPNGGKVTVQQAKTLYDDTKIILEGNIINKLYHEHYTLKDSTGEIIIEIDDDDWYGHKIRVGQKIRVYGEIDTHHNRPISIDVNAVEILP